MVFTNQKKKDKESRMIKLLRKVKLWTKIKKKKSDTKNIMIICILPFKIPPLFFMSR